MNGPDVWTMGGVGAIVATVLVLLAGCAYVLAVQHDLDRALVARWDRWRRDRADVRRVTGRRR